MTACDQHDIACNDHTISVFFRRRWNVGGITTEDEPLIESVAINARPLVVIDPEDREQVTELWRAIGTAPQSDTRPLVDVLRDALRSLIAPPKPRCVAHGVIECDSCSRITSEYLTDDGDCKGCSSWGSDGMHWDTCPGRIRGTVYANRDEAMTP